MRNITVLLFFVLSILNLKAQTLEWITSGAGDYIYSNQDIGYSVASNDDFVYISGYVAGNNVKIQDTSIYHGKFSFIAKYDKSGDLKWIRENEGEEVSDVSINSNGEVYTIYTTWDLENHILKFDENGNELWDKVVYNIDKIKSITIDKDDNLILTGHFNAYTNSLTIEDTVIHDISQDRTNSFVMKYNSDGEFQWFNTTRIISGYGGYIVFHDIQSDNNGGIFVIGDYELYDENDSVRLGDYYLNSESNPAYAPNYFSHKDIVLAKLDPEGKFLWANEYGGYNDDLGNRIAVNESGEVFMVGNFTDSISFDDIKLVTYGIDIYLSKLSTTGSIVWANKLGCNSANSILEEGRTVAVDENSVYVGGMYDGRYYHFGSTNLEDTIINIGSNIRSGFMARYSLEGDFIGVNNLLTVNNLNVETAKIEDININNDNIYVTGNFYPPSTFFNTIIPIVYNNTNHFFLASLNKNSTTNLSENNFKKIDFYPNPAKDYIVVEFENEYNKNGISIYDLKGNILISKKSTGIKSVIDISSLKNGLYILIVSINNSNYIEKFIKVE